MKYNFFIIFILFAIYPLLSMGELTGSRFYSYGLYKNECLSFINDSICIYKQEWDADILKGSYQYVDTFIYYRINPTKHQQKKVDRWVIKNVNPSVANLPQNEMIDRNLHDKLSFNFPQYAIYQDRCSGLTLISPALRKSRYDIPSLGHHSNNALRYATLHHIAIDTVWGYNNKFICLGTTGNKLYPAELYDIDPTRTITRYTNGSLAEEASYEYLRYCYHHGITPYPQLEKEEIAGHSFFHSLEWKRGAKCTIQEELLSFLNDSCVLYKKDNEELKRGTYELIHNLIVIKSTNLIGNLEIDTLAYNRGFIFYAKQQPIVEQNPTSLRWKLIVKIFHERICPDSLANYSCMEKKAFKKRKSYDYIEYKDFDDIVHETYIPINY